MIHLSRRSFMASTTAAAVMGTGPLRAADTGDTPWAGEKIVDCHYHGKPTDAGIIAHLNGAGITATMVSVTQDYTERMREVRRNYPGRVLGWARSTRMRSDDPNLQLPVPVTAGMELPAGSIPAIDAVPLLRESVAHGAKGFSETTGLVYADGPELQRLYALAAELDVAIMMHFQQSAVPGQPRYGISGFSRIEAMLKKYPKTRFVCHASDFWGNIDAKYVDGGAYPSGKVTPGGLSDRLLADYPNMYGDCGAPSGMIAMGRDPEFTSGFLTRHRHKLIFGSDCGCTDGRGGSDLPPASAAAPPPPAGANGVRTVPVGNLGLRMAAQGGYAGKCVAREILSILWRNAPRDVFRDLAWNNAMRVYKLTA